MTIKKKIILSCMVMVLSFTGLVSHAQADYYKQGIVKSHNLLVGASVTAINSFTATSVIPANTTVSVQFSQDRVHFYSSAGVESGWDTLSDGVSVVDLSGLSWSGAALYYKLKLATTDSTLTPEVDDIKLNYTGTDVVIPTEINQREGTFVSNNMLSGASVEAINSVTVSASLPKGTSALIQFSQNQTDFYSSSGTANGWDSLTDGTNLISLSGLGWTSALYYRIKLATIDGMMISKINDVTVDFTGTVAPPPTGEEYPPIGYLVSKDLLSGPTSVFSQPAYFAYNIAYLPSGSSVSVQFSQDGSNWYDASGTLWGWTSLSAGSHLTRETAINLSALDWTGATDFYYKLKLTTSDINWSPLVSDAGLLNANKIDMGSAGTVGSGPIAEYKFNAGYGSVVHNSGSAGSADDGTWHGTGTHWTKNGHEGEAGDFNGTDDYVNCGDEDDMDLRTHNLTVSAWIKTSTSGVHQMIVSKKLSYSSPYQGWFLTIENNKIHGGFRWDSSHIASTEGLININDDKWHYVTLSIIFGGNVQLYVDGVADGNSASSVGATDVNPATNLVIGRFSDGSGYSFNGSIDDVKIWDRALSADEVKQEYNDGKALVLGSSGTDSSTGAPTNASSGEYCVPGSTDYCAPPVGEWKMDTGKGTTAYDTSGNGNDGTWNGTGTHWTQGKLGKAGNFNGTDDYVNMGDIELPTTDFTYSIWINLKENTDEMILMAADGSGGNEVVMYIHDNGGGNHNFEIGVHNDTFSTGAINIPIDKWVNVVFTRSGINGIGYINGVADASFSNGVALNFSSCPLLIGVDTDEGCIGSLDNYFNGKIDDIRIYNYARTPAQIAWDYNHGKPIAEYRFNECSGTIIHDESKNGNDGTLTVGSSGSQTQAGTCADGLATSAWYNGRNGKENASLNFDGTDDYVNVGDVGNINAISFWLKQDYTNANILDLDGGTHTVTLSNSTVTATGFSSPTIYIDGVNKSILPDNAWHHILITTNTAIDANNIDIGKIGSNYFTGQIDDIKLYNYALTATQAKTDFSGGAIGFGYSGITNGSALVSSWTCGDGVVEGDEDCECGTGNWSGNVGDLSCTFTMHGCNNCVESGGVPAPPYP